MIDIALPDDSNFSTKGIEKLSKYKQLEFQISRMWKVKTKCVSVVTGTLGTIKKGLDQNRQLLEGHSKSVLIHHR